MKVAPVLALAFACSACAALLGLGDIERDVVFADDGGGASSSGNGGSSGASSGSSGDDGATEDAPGDGRGDGCNATAPTNGLVGYWKFDEGTGTTAIDSSGANHPGTLMDNATYVAGRCGSAVAFDGNLARVEFPSLTGLSFPQSGTLSIWFKGTVADQPGQGWLVDVYEQTRDHIFLGHKTDMPECVATLGQKIDGGTDFVWQLAADVIDGQWNHAVLSWDSTNHHVVYVMNNVVKADEAIAATWAPRDQQLSLSPHGSSGGFKGAVDEMRLYDRAMTVSEIMSLP